MADLDLVLAKQHLRVLNSDEDAIIQQYLDAATLDVERISGDLLTRREVTQTFSAFGSWLPLNWGPLPEDVTISYFDSDDAAQEIADARIVRNRAYPNTDAWPEIYTDSQISMTYTAGWEEPPADLIDAVLVLVGGKFDQREGAYADALRAAESICGRNRTMMV